VARWVRRRDSAGRVLAIASQRSGALERYGITREQADRAAWTIDARGRRLEGAAALNRVLEELGGGWKLMARAYRLRPIAAAEEAIYRWFAPRRSRFHRLGVTPECDDPAAGCA
jgi:predicted DCC family thiol-disulfide oxidoreductase YuxK